VVPRDRPRVLDEAPRCRPKRHDRAPIWASRTPAVITTNSGNARASSITADADVGRTSERRHQTGAVSRRSAHASAAAGVGARRPRPRISAISCSYSRRTVGRSKQVTQNRAIRVHARSARGAPNDASESRPGEPRVARITALRAGPCRLTDRCRCRTRPDVISAPRGSSLSCSCRSGGW
jgi:hypothetical protein